MPRRFHSEYLRQCLLENNLAKPNRLNMLGQGFDLSRVTIPFYVVAGSEDHIVPWRTGHRARARFSVPTRLILGSVGHIGSVINPPSTVKGAYYTNESPTTDSDEWFKTATRQSGSRWPDWTKWLSEKSADLVPPPPMGNGE